MRDAGAMSPVLETSELLNMLRKRLSMQQVRVLDWFQDYDRLRTGYITAEQFRRGLSNCNIEIKDAEFAALSDDYDDNNRRPGMFHYTRFCNDVSNVFNAELEKTPSAEPLATPKNGVREPNPLSESEAALLDTLLARLQHEARTRGLHVKTCFMDFDRQRNGLITPSQFRRSLPFRLSDNEAAVLLKRYTDRFTQQVMYRVFHEDLEKHGKPAVSAAAPAPAATAAAVDKKEAAAAVPAVSSPATRSGHEVLQALQDYVYSHRFRVSDMFSSYDPLHKGVISEPQLCSGLGLLTGFPLAAAEYKALADLFRHHEDPSKIRYKDLAMAAEAQFVVHGLEKTPDAPASPPPHQGTRSRAASNVSASKETQAQTTELMERMRKRVRDQHMLIKPFFQHFDRHHRGTVNKSHFERTLSVLGLYLSSREVQLLAQRFLVADGSVDYLAFIEELEALPPKKPDPALARRLSRRESSTSAPDARTASGSAAAPGSSTNTSNAVDVDALLTRIRSKVEANRLRISDFLRDYDVYRRGVILAVKMRSGLDNAGFAISEAEFAALASHYSTNDATTEPMVRWRDFVADVDKVYAQQDLERDPTRPIDTLLVPVAADPQAAAIAAAAGAAPTGLRTSSVGAGSASASPGAVLVAEVHKRLGEMIHKRRLLIEPVFKDFDLRRNGHITPLQFQRVLSSVGFGISPEEVQACKACYCDASDNLNYRVFLRDVDDLIAEVYPSVSMVSLPGTGGPAPATSAAGQQSSTSTTDTTPATSTAAAAAAAAAAVQQRKADLEPLLMRLRLNVKRRQLRVQEYFRDYDRLRSGYVAQAKFISGLDMCMFNLSNDERNMLVAHYQNDDGTIGYGRFCDDMELVFTRKGLEKNPDAAPIDAAALVKEATKAPTLDPLTQKSVDATINALRSRVRMRRLMVKPFFQDYDRVHKGHVTKAQFRNVLGTLALTVTEAEVQALFQAIADGESGNVSYTRFCDLIQA